MVFRPQTAIRGVFSVGLINLAARLLGYGRYVLIAAFLGISAPLDAYYMAFSILTLAIFSFGDVFDSLGIPRLVKILQGEGEEAFRETAGSIFAFSFLLSAVLGATLMLASPWTPWIAPGFSGEKKEAMLRNLLYLAPVALLYLPYHATGSFLRAKRRFQVFYLGELVIAAASFSVIAFLPGIPYVVPLSVSVAYVAAFLFIAAVGRREVRFPGKVDMGEIREFARLTFRLLPVYFFGYLFLLVDRAFASLLPTGGVSALSFAMLIATVPASTLMMENVFITPLAETAERGEMMRNILHGVLIISLPIAVFTFFHARLIVEVALERGAFTSTSTAMTADALRLLALIIPATFINPVSYRLFQVLGKLQAISVISFGAVAVNASLNFLFMEMGMGIRGVALAMAISLYVAFLCGALLLGRYGTPVLTRNVLSVLLISLGVSGAALGVTHLLPIGGETVAGLLFRGVAYVLVAGALFLAVPNPDVRHWMDTVRREFSRGRREAGR